LSWRAKVFVVEFALAVRVTLWTEVTAETVAEKVALLAPAGTTTDAGRVTALLLPESAMLKPPVGADPESAIVHVSLPAPVMLALWQENALSVVMTAAPCLIPFPWSFTCVTWSAVAFVEMLKLALESVSAVGLYFSSKLTVLAEATFRGRLPAPSMENEGSDMLNCEIWTGEELEFEMATD